ncbi:MAG: fibro-slime domain-containing protein [Fibrobacterales bacterium]
MKVHYWSIHIFLLLSVASTLFAQKELHLHSPWDNAIPQIVIEGTATLMSPDIDHCGWYTYQVDQSQDLKEFYFTNKYGKNYGNAGDDDTSYISLETMIQEHNDVYLHFPSTTQLNSSATRIKVNNSPSCLVGILRGEIFDWKELDLDSAFQPPESCTGRIDGLIENKLIDSLPVPTKLGRQKCMNSVSKWFKPNAKKDNTQCVDLELNITPQGTFRVQYDKHSKNDGFFPIDNFTNDNNMIGKPILGDTDNRYTHNYHYCMKTSNTFTYQTGQSFTFIGDDDVWVFIDDSLFLDIGGVHGSETETKTLDEFLSRKDANNDIVYSEGNEPGTTHRFDLFYCERNTVESNLTIETDLDFDQPIRYGHQFKTQQDGVLYTIQKGEYSSSGCDAESGSITNISTFYLKEGEPESEDDPTDFKELTPGKTYHGGIEIRGNKHQVLINEKEMEGLLPGTYTVYYQTTDATRNDYGSFTFFVTNKEEIKKGRPLEDPEREGGYHSYLDMNSDGTLDRIQLYFKEIPTLNALDQQNITFHWPHNDGTNLESYEGNWGQIEDSHYFYWNIPERYTIREYTTSITKEQFATATVVVETDDGEDSTYTFPITDRMPPVLKEAVLKSTPEIDRLLITLSEPVETEEGDLLRSYEARSRDEDDSFETVRADSTSFNFLEFGETEHLLIIDVTDEHPVERGDSLRIRDIDDGIFDAEGNRPGDSTRAIQVNSELITTLGTSDYTVADWETFEDPETMLNPKVDIIPIGSPLDSNRAGLQKMLNMHDVLYDRLDSKAKGTVHPERYSFVITMHTFSALGQYINTSDTIIQCNDTDIFEGEVCTSIRPENGEAIAIYPPYFSTTGRLLGSGIYIVSSESYYQYTKGEQGDDDFEIIRTEVTSELFKYGLIRKE